MLVADTDGYSSHVVASHSRKASCAGVQHSASLAIPDAFSHDSHAEAADAPLDGGYISQLIAEEPGNEGFIQISNANFDLGSPIRGVTFQPCQSDQVRPSIAGRISRCIGESFVCAPWSRRFSLSLSLSLSPPQVVLCGPQ
jgi:hypothetical protein